MVTSEVYMLLTCLLYRWGHTIGGRKMTPNVSKQCNQHREHQTGVLFEKQISQNYIKENEFQRIETKYIDQIVRCKAITVPLDGLGF